jgi:hypothetical protein
MSEPTTPTGKRLAEQGIGAIANLRRVVLTIEAEARQQGAEAERERLLEKAAADANAASDPTIPLGEAWLQAKDRLLQAYVWHLLAEPSDDR